MTETLPQFSEAEPTGFTPDEVKELEEIGQKGTQEKESGKMTAPVGSPENPDPTLKKDSPKETPPPPPKEDPRPAPKEPVVETPKPEPKPPVEPRVPAEKEDEDEDLHKPPPMVPAYRLDKVREQAQKRIQELESENQALKSKSSPSDVRQAQDEALRQYAEDNDVTYESIAKLRDIFFPKEDIEFIANERKSKQERERVAAENAKQIDAFNQEFSSEQMQNFFREQGLTEAQTAQVKTSLMDEAFKFPKGITIDRIYLATPGIHPRADKHSGEISRPSAPGSQPISADDALAEKLSNFDELPEAEQVKIIKAMPLDVFEKWENARVKGQHEVLEWYDGLKTRKIEIKPF